MLKKQYSRLRFFVVWVGGDKQKLASWAKANKINNIGLAVIATDARNPE